MTDPPRPIKPLVELEVAIEGDGIRPEDVPLDQLAELLSATAATLKALAEEAGSPVVLPALVAIRPGSAAAALASPALAWPAEAARLMDVARARGRGASPRVRAALQRMHRAGKLGAVRLVARGLAGPRFDAPVRLAEPAEPEELALHHTAVVYGRLVGINDYERGPAVRLEFQDGGRREYRIDRRLEAVASRLYGKTVRLRAVGLWDGESDSDWRVEDISAWAERELLDILSDVRADLAARGVRIDPDAWMRELDDE